MPIPVGGVLPERRIEGRTATVGAGHALAYALAGAGPSRRADFTNPRQVNIWLVCSHIMNTSKQHDWEVREACPRRFAVSLTIQ